MFVLKIDVHNREECVKCSAIIDAVINRNNKVYRDVTLVSLLENMGCKLFESQNSNIIINKLEEPLSKKKGTEIDSAKSIPLGNVLNYSTHVHFYIRIINSNEEEKSHYHYVATIFEKHRDLIERERLSMFFAPTTGDKYPFEKDGIIDLETIDIASRYFRCLINNKYKGRLYSVDKQRSASDYNIVKALEHNIIFPKNYNKTKAYYFPIMIFDNISEPDSISRSIDYINSVKLGNPETRHNESLTKVNNYELLFSESIYVEGKTNDIHILEKYLDTIFDMPYFHRRFGYADSENTNLALCDYVFETAFIMLMKKIEEIDENLSEYRKAITETFSDSPIFSFALFSFIVDFNECKTSNDIIKEINKTKKISNEIGYSIKQIIQNSIQHSREKKAIVSFFIENDCLKITVSDFSDKTISQTFIQNLQNEHNIIKDDYDNYSNIINTERYYKKILSDSKSIVDIFEKQTLNLNCFYNDFNDESKETKALWNNFRTTDSSAHIGLSLFANAVKKCNGSFRVISSNDYYLPNPQKSDVYYFNMANPPSNRSVFAFPGTEYSIVLPIKSTSNLEAYNIAKLKNQYFVENYDSYNKYLDYSGVEIFSPSKNKSFKETFNNIYVKLRDAGINDAENKFKGQMLWTSFWIAVFDDLNKEVQNKAFFYIDYEKIFREGYMPSEHLYEVFAKGLINALGIVFNESKNKVFFAIINSSKHFIEIFKQITTSLSIKLFPKNIQLFCSDINNQSHIHLFGDNYYSAIRNSYILSIENGTNSYDGKDYYEARSLFSVFGELNQADSKNDEKVDLFPFSGVINGVDRSLFFERIRKIADNDITNGNGYMFKKSHMRIGNKVHLDAFYEMSYLFYRTIMANNVAFYILRDLISNNIIDIESDRILFYGYASYSQAILTSLVSIANRYSGNNNFFYASYLYNSQSDRKQNEVKIYFNDIKSIKEYLNIEKGPKKSLKVIQIVPISSTMTTFSKMWSLLKIDYKAQVELLRNYTVFWVRDIGNNNLEDNYYAKPQDKFVKTKFTELPTKEVQYIILGGANWEKPETCRQCFPENILDEVPLIETDQTSTIPSQQIYLINNTHSKIKTDINTKKRLASLLGCVHYGHFRRGKNHFQYYIDTQSYFNSVADDVKLWLEDLKEKHEKESESVNYPYINIIFSPVHNSNVGFSQYVNSYYFNGSAEIISVDEDKQFRSNFVCEHNELKRIISRITEDYIISKMNLKNYEDCLTDSEFKTVIKDFRPVRFTFVDDNLITGETFRKASSLLQSLIPAEILENYTTNVFENCFLLINRLSGISTKAYVLEPNGFNAFCSINISNMRTQGDSCVGCKLQADAERLYKRSATQKSADYWANKCDSYKAESYEDINISEYTNCSYMRMIISHIYKNYISLGNNSGQDSFVALVYFFSFLLGKTDNDFDTKKVITAEQKAYLEGSKELITLRYAEEGENEFGKIDNNEVESYRNYADTKHIVECAIKILTRPFFIFNQDNKAAALKFMIILAENILCKCRDFKASNLSKTEEYAIKTTSEIISLYNYQSSITFLQKYVFEALSDLHSTYLFRKKTIKKVLEYFNSMFLDLNIRSKFSRESAKNDIDKKLKGFFEDYAIFIQKVIDCGSDETRALRLEHLLVTGFDDYENYDSSKTMLLFDNIIKSWNKRRPLNEKVKQYFGLFCDEVFLQNGIVLYDGIKKLFENDEKDIEKYFFERWRNYKIIDAKYILKEENAGNRYYESETELYKYIISNNNNNNADSDDINNDKKSDSEDINNNIIELRYENLIAKIGKMISDKYSIESKKIYISILTGNNSSGKKLTIKNLEIIKNDFEEKMYLKNRQGGEINTEQHISQYKYMVKQIILHLQDSNDSQLDNYGYFVSSSDYSASDVKKLINSMDTLELIKNDKFVVLKFDNSGCKTKFISDKEIKKIIPVYIFIHIGKDEIADSAVPMVMRDLLIYRNSFMYYFQEDFTSDVMQRYSHSLDTEAVLKNEKIVSHTSIRKDIAEIESIVSKERETAAFGNADLNKKDYSIEIKNWAIARNHCNMIIARLYNRVFMNSNKSFKRIVSDALNNRHDESYKLYVNHFDGISKPLKEIKEVLPIKDKNTIYNLLDDLLSFDFDDTLYYEDVKVISKESEGKSYYYNTEFVKNIIYRICFDSLRFDKYAGLSNENFVERIYNHYKEVEIRNNLKQEINDGRHSIIIKEKGVSPNVDYKCKISFSVEECKDSDNFDWLVIKNHVDVHVPEKEKIINDIRQKMEDPIDFSDGHMSLITAKEYLARMINEEDQELLSNMYQYENEYFVTRLPIIKKRRDNNGK